MRHYRSDGERNLWYAAAERWRDAGRSYLDDARFMGPRRWPLPLPVVVFVLVIVATLGLWRVVTG